MGWPVEPSLSGSVSSVLVLGVADVVDVIDEFTSRLRAHRAELNAINVFPVADNDTGTNMVRSLEAVTAASAGATDLKSLAAAVENAALSGRGNSGLIIGQFLAGFTSAANGDRLDVGAGLVAAAALAREAVASPVEGTMLTVADSVAAVIVGDPTVGVEQLAVHADVAVAATTEQLAVLAERGVVDSGAFGLAMFFGALASVVGGAADSGPEDGVEADGREIICDVGNNRVADHPIGALTSISMAYEIQFRVVRSVVDVGELQTILSSLGTDVVVASSADHLSAHVHVSDPHVATSAISAQLESRPTGKAISYDVEAIAVRAQR